MTIKWSVHLVNDVCVVDDTPALVTGVRLSLSDPLPATFDGLLSALRKE